MTSIKVYIRHHEDAKNNEVIFFCGETEDTRQLAGSLICNDAEVDLLLDHLSGDALPGLESPLLVEDQRRSRPDTDGFKLSR